MDSYSLSQNAGMALVGVALFLSTMLAAGSFLVRAACRIWAGFVPPHNMAIKAVFICMMASSPLVLVSSILAESARTAVGVTMALALTALSFLLQAWLLGLFIKHPENGPIGIRTGAMVSIIWSGLFLLGAFVVGVALAVLLPLFSNGQNTPEQKPLEQFAKEAQRGRAPIDLFLGSAPAAAPVATPANAVQQQLDRAVDAAMAKYPMLRWGTATENKEAINKVVALRDYYITDQHLSPAAALTAAADEIGRSYEVDAAGSLVRKPVAKAEKRKPPRNDARDCLRLESNEAIARCSRRQ